MYCEITDIEHETAGLLYADRTIKDLGGCVPADVHADTVLIFDLVPVQAAADPTQLGVRVSHHGTGAVTGRLVAGWVPAGTPMSADLPKERVRSAEVTVVPFRVTDAVSLDVPPPSPAGPARLIVWLDDGDSVQARGFVDAGVIEEITGRARLEAQATTSAAAG